MTGQGIQLVVVDLIPALMTPPGRGDVEMPDGVGEVLAELFGRYRLAGIADAEQTGAELRRILEDRDLAAFFESVGTAAGFGPTVSARVLRRLISTARVSIDRTVVVTGRVHLAEHLTQQRFSVVVTEGPDGFLGVPAALAALEAGHLTP